MVNLVGAFRRMSTLVCRSKVEPFKFSPNECCIYRVPLPLRRAKPEAYTPHMVLIGPLHHAKKREACQMEREKSISFDIEDTKYRYRLYLDMEEQKQNYYQSFYERVGVEKETVLKRYIENYEERIRRCYAESTAWIDRLEFVDLIHLDAIFIMELMLRHNYKEGQHRVDFMLTNASLYSRVCLDLILLENQLPFFILEELFSIANPKSTNPRIQNLSLRKLVLSYFQVEGFPDDIKFKHFTDLKRYLRIGSLKVEDNCENKSVKHLYNAEKLRESGVCFVAIDKDSSIHVTFENKQLKMARLEMYCHIELELRNIIALEQCHYFSEMHVLSYVWLLDLLICTEKDVEILVKRGIIQNSGNDYGWVANMINNLSHGHLLGSWCYDDLADQLNKHYENRWNRTKAALKHNYFYDLWQATATLAAIILLLLSAIQTSLAYVEYRKCKLRELFKKMRHPTS